MRFLVALLLDIHPQDGGTEYLEIQLKRFIETNDWREPWFRQLSPQAKHLHRYLWDNCDCAGVITFDLEAITFHVGQRIEEKHLSELEGWSERLPNGQLLIPSFINVQVGDPSPTCPPHKPVFKAIAVHGLVRSETLYHHHTHSLPCSLPVNSEGSLPCRQQYTDKEKEPEKDKTEGVQGEIDVFPDSLNTPEFKEAWNRWHEHLKQKRKPATIHSRDLQLNKMAKIGVTRAIAALNYSVENNWQGIWENNNSEFPLKPNEREKTDAEKVAETF